MSKPYPTEPAPVLSDKDIHRMFDELKWQQYLESKRQKIKPYMEISNEMKGGEF